MMRQLRLTWTCQGEREGPKQGSQCYLPLRYDTGLDASQVLTTQPPTCIVLGVLPASGDRIDYPVWPLPFVPDWSVSIAADVSWVKTER
jgi:hypothetical protein